MAKARPLSWCLSRTRLAAAFCLWPCASASADVSFTLNPAGSDGQATRWKLVGSSDHRCQAVPAVPGRVVCENVYPGIRLTLDGGTEGVTYRFDVASGVDPGAIRMRYEGADEARVEGDALLVHFGDKTLREKGLRCFQDASRQRDVACHYVVANASEGIQVTLDIGSYDRSQPLFIDPEIGWSSYLGGYRDDLAYSVAMDSNGNAYITGETFSSDFPVNVGGFQPSYGTGGDAFVTKVDSGGSNLAWSSYLGGSDGDQGLGIALDSGGNVYVTGRSRCVGVGGCASDFPSGGGFDSSHEGDTEAFVTKVDSTGSTLVWSSYLGGGDDDTGYDVAVDSDGNVYVVGFTESTDFPTAGGFDTSYAGGGDAFVVKVDVSGSSLVWSSYLGGGGIERGQRIALDSDRNVYLTGETDSADFPTASGFDTDPGGNGDAFVTKVDAAGSSLAWSSFLGGAGYDSGRGIAVDSGGHVYIAGFTYSSDFPSTGGFDTSLGGAADAFVTMIDAAGPTLTWSSYLGGDDDDFGYGIALDLDGNPYLTGETASADFPTPGGFDTSLGMVDAFVTKVDAASSTLAWSSYLGGSGAEEGNGVAVDTSGNICVTGYTLSSFDFPLSDAFDAVSECGAGAPCVEGFVTKIVICGNAICDAAEDACTCSLDCSSVCGDGCCTGTEDSGSCSADCFCGDGACAADEGTCDCPEDCGSSCGDGCCSGTEDKCVCSTDCTADVCGDGCCTGGETSASCSSDCPVCSNGICEPLETACTCPDDCDDTCGDDCCGVAEDCDLCSIDCGACPEPTPEPVLDASSEPPRDLGPDSTPDGTADGFVDAAGDARIDAPRDASKDGSRDAPSDIVGDTVDDTVAVADTAIDSREPLALDGVVALGDASSAADLAVGGRSSDSCACRMGGRPSPASSALVFWSILALVWRRMRGA